jgi:hypothetical protein
MLIFDGCQVRWECLCSHGSERSPKGGMSRHIGHHQSIRTGINDDTEFFDLPQYDDKDFASRGQLQHWCYTVMDYTHRGMTVSSDRLVALDGIVQALGKHTKMEYYAGLWEEKFSLGLLWSISHTNEYTPTTTDAFNLKKNERVRHEEDLAPSWSWVSVTVPVVYPVPTITYLDRICNILDVSVAGTPAKKTGRLEIRGQMRKGYVNPIYPYAIPQATTDAPGMTIRKPDGSKNMASYRGRVWNPNDFFIFTESMPSGTFGRLASPSWRLIRGTFRPDEIIDSSTRITFIAIAQMNDGHNPESIVRASRT